MRFQTNKHWIYVSELGAADAFHLEIVQSRLAMKRLTDRWNFQPLSPSWDNCPKILTISGQTVVFWSLNSNLQSKVLVQAWRCGGIEMHSFKLSIISGKWPASHPGWKKCLVSCEQGAGWRPEPAWTLGRWQKSLTPCQELNESSVVQSVA